MRNLSTLVVGSVLCSVCVTAGAMLQAPGREAERASLPSENRTVRADQFPSLQAAIDALPAEGGMVLLPAGTIEIAAPVIVTQDDVLIQGCGTASHIRNINTDGQPGFVVGPPAGPSDEEKFQWRVTLADFRLTGNKQSGHGIAVKDVNEIYINGVTVSENGGDGIHLDHAYEDPRICNSLITYNAGTGLFLTRCHDIVVSANQFEENQDAVRCLDSYNLCMTGNNLDDHLGDGVVIENTYGSVLSGNMLEECKGTAIVLDRDCYGITLSANVIAHHQGGGIDLRDAHGCAVSGNTFTLVKQHALRIGPGSGRITVTGNNFSNSDLGSETEPHVKNQEPASGLVLDGTESVTVCGNLFSGLDTPAVASPRPSRSVLFANNVIDDVAEQPGIPESPGGHVSDNLLVLSRAETTSAPDEETQAKPTN